MSWSNNGRVYREVGHQAIIKFWSTLRSDTTLVGHNIIGYDLPALFKVLGVRWQGKVVDTLLLSKLAWPDKFDHSLKAWGIELGVLKGTYAQDTENAWAEYSEEMGSYCDQDVAVTKALHLQLIDDMKDWDWGHSINMEHQFAKDFAVQGYRGVFIDQELATKLVDDVTQEMLDIEAEVEPLLPPAEGNKSQLAEVTPPKIQFKKDGTPSALCEKWFDAVYYTDGLGTTVDEATPGMWVGEKFGSHFVLPTPVDQDGSRLPLITHFPAKLSNQEHIKAWLMEQGWEPTMWSFKKAKDKNNKYRVVRGDDGQPVVSQPKFHDKGELCPNLVSIQSEFPHVNKLVRWIVIRHRRGLVSGVLEALRPNGTVPATGMSLGTPTSRVTHSVVANVPKAEDNVVLGKECRAIFPARPGRVMAGVDASGLELRCLAHRVGSPELVEIVCNGNKEDGSDIHSINAASVGTDRHTAKTLVYGWLYGAGDDKLGSVLGGGKDKGAKAREALVAGIPGLSDLMKKVDEASKKGYIKALDGRKIPLRSKHATLNTILQSDGSILVKTAQCYMNRKIRELGLDAMQVISYHDEVQLDCANEEAGLQAGQLFIDGLRYAGRLYGFRCPLDGEVKVGRNWADTH